MGLKQKAIQIYEKVDSFDETIDASPIVDETKTRVSFLKKALDLLNQGDKAENQVTKQIIDTQSEKDSEETVDDFEVFSSKILDGKELEDELNKWENDAKELFLSTPFQPLNDKDVTAEDLESEYSEFVPQEEVYRKKIENYLSLFEAIKDIISSKTFEEFYENIVYSVIGQIGVESVVIFATDSKQQRFGVVDYDGVDIEEDWFFESSDKLLSLLDSENYIIPARNLLNKNLSEREVDILEKVNTSIIASVRTYDELLGIMLLGNPMNSDDYSPEDLEFVQIIGEISGTYLLRLKEILSTTPS